MNPQPVKSKNLNANAISELADGMIASAKRLMKHANKHPIVTSRDVGEIRATTKLCLDLVNKSTTDPMFMAHIVKSMTPDQLSALNDWIHENKRMGK